MGLQTILAMVQILDHTAARMRVSMHGRTLVEMAIVRICQLGELDDLATLVAELRGSGTAKSRQPTATVSPPAVSRVTAKKNDEPRPADSELATIPPLQPIEAPRQSRRQPATRNRSCRAECIRRRPNAAARRPIANRRRERRRLNAAGSSRSRCWRSCKRAMANGGAADSRKRRRARVATRATGSKSPSSRLSAARWNCSMSRRASCAIRRRKATQLTSHELRDRCSVTRDSGNDWNTIVFKGLGNLANLGALMKQAQEMGGKMQAIQEELKTKRATGAAGGGLVEVDVNGLAEVLAVRIDPSLVEKGDREMIEDLLPAAFNAAQQKAKQMHAEAMQSTHRRPADAGLARCSVAIAPATTAERRQDVSCNARVVAAALATALPCACVACRARAMRTSRCRAKQSRRRLPPISRRVARISHAIALNSEARIEGAEFDLVRRAAVCYIASSEQAVAAFDCCAAARRFAHWHNLNRRTAPIEHIRCDFLLANRCSWLRSRCLHRG